MNTYSLDWHEWFDKAKSKKLKHDFKSLYQTLRRNKLLKLTVRKWLREQIGETIEMSEENKEMIESMRRRWLIENGLNIDNQNREDEMERILKKYNMTNEILDIYAMNETKALRWAQKQWSHAIPQIYLDKKDNFDYAKVKTISANIKDKDLMNEIYYAVKAKEYLLEEASDKYIDKIKGTRAKGITLKISDMKPAMRYNVINSPPKQISLPFRLEDSIIIIEVIDYKESALNEEIRLQIVQDNLSGFISYGVERIIEELCERDHEGAD